MTVSHYQSKFIKKLIELGRIPKNTVSIDVNYSVDSVPTITFTTHVDDEIDSALAETINELKDA